MIHRIISVFAFVIVLAFAAIAQSPIVPVDHPVYPFMARMEAKGLISGYFDATLPMDRGQVCELLRQLGDSNPNSDVLTSVDRGWLQYFRQEFWEYEWDAETPACEFLGWRRVKQTGFFQWLRVGDFWERSHDWFSGSGDSYSWALNPILRYDFVSDDRYDHTIQRRTSGIDFRAAWNGRLGIFFRFHDTKEWGNGPYRDRHKVYDDHYAYIGPLLGDDFTYYDRADYGIHLKWGRFRLEGGKWQSLWGTGRWGHLLLSDEATSYDQVRLKVEIGNWGQFTALTGALKQYPPYGDTLYVTAAGDYRIVQASKYVSAHRLDVKPCRNLQLGFSEMVIYGDRGIELGYLIPLNLYFSAEHHYGDQDNVMWGMDFKYTGIRGVRWYGEFMLDDLTIAKLWKSDPGNKWAALVGALWVDPVGFRNFEVGAEATVIRPYVYTHRYIVNIPTHWTRSLGHSAPPNSLTWTVGGNYQFRRDLRLSIQYDYQKHGANTDDLNVGGDVNLPHRSGDQATVSFLDGDIQISQYWSGSLSWEPFPRLRLEVAGGMGSGDIVEDYDWVRAGLYLNF